MDVAVIAPPSMLKWTSSMTRTHLVLAHIYNSPSHIAYREYYKDCVAAGHFVMLDNSAYELGGSVALDQLLKAAEDLQPSAVFLPDTRFKSEVTLQQVKQAIEVFDQKKDEGKLPATMQLFAVPQGENLQDVLYCYNQLLALEVDGFGFYEEIGQVCGFKNRAEFLWFMEAQDHIRPGKYYHLLGMEEDVKEVQLLSKFDWANSIDSAKPVVYAINGIAFADRGALVGYPHRPSNYFKLQDTEFGLLAQHNIAKLLEWAGSPQAKYVDPKSKLQFSEAYFTGKTGESENV
jgi:hypothetical protein